MGRVEIRFAGYGSVFRLAEGRAGRTRPSRGCVSTTGGVPDELSWASRISCGRIHMQLETSKGSRKMRNGIASSARVL